MKTLVEQRLVEVVRQGLDDSVRGLDWQMQARLTGLRRQALERESRPSGWLGAISFSHGFVAASIATLVVGLWVLPDKHTSFMPASFLPDKVSEISGADVVGANAVMDVLISGEDMDFLENLEMYEWLDAEYG